MLISALCLSSCHNEPQDPAFVHLQQSDQKEKEDPYLEWNRVNVGREDEDIDFFTNRYGWDVQKTGTGLRIEMLENGTGDLVKSEQTVALEYSTCLLTGDTVYSSAKQGVKQFKVDKSSEIAGLNEAVKMMRKGSKAHLVIPSFLAYGVAGDGQRIRGKVSLAMTVEVVDVQND